MTGTGGVTGEDKEHGMSRRQLLRHGAWFGSAVALTVVGGEVISHVAGHDDTPKPAGGLRFVQVSDSHIGFTGPANTDVTGSFEGAIGQINALGYEPDFVMHTGDLTHLSTAGQFDQVKQMMNGLRTGRVFTVPGEHDSVDDAGRSIGRRSATRPAATAGTASTSRACMSSGW